MDSHSWGWKHVSHPVTDLLKAYMKNGCSEEKRHGDVNVHTRHMYIKQILQVENQKLIYENLS